MTAKADALASIQQRRASQKRNLTHIVQDWLRCFWKKSIRRSATKCQLMIRKECKQVHPLRLKTQSLSQLETMILYT
eukprot:scaffold206164_cov17-Prasinocladus_malaysianus.AAC.1